MQHFLSTCLLILSTSLLGTDIDKLSKRKQLSPSIECADWIEDYWFTTKTCLLARRLFVANSYNGKSHRRGNVYVMRRCCCCFCCDRNRCSNCILSNATFEPPLWGLSVFVALVWVQDHSFARFVIAKCLLLLSLSAALPLNLLSRLPFLQLPLGKSEKRQQ